MAPSGRPLPDFALSSRHDAIWAETERHSSGDAGMPILIRPPKRPRGPVQSDDHDGVVGVETEQIRQCVGQLRGTPQGDFAPCPRGRVTRNGWIADRTVSSRIIAATRVFALSLCHATTVPGVARRLSSAVHSKCRL